MKRRRARHWRSRPRSCRSGRSSGSGRSARMPAKRENRAEGLRDLKTDELSQKLAVLTEEKFRLEFRRATESLTNPLQLRTIRRDIARIKTILKERASA